jgi:hypothetical protein
MHPLTSPALTPLDFLKPQIITPGSSPENNFFSKGHGFGKKIRSDKCPGVGRKRWDLSRK